MLSSKVLAIISIVALVCIITLVTLQLLEASFLSAAPSVWPG